MQRFHFTTWEVDFAEFEESLSRQGRVGIAVQSVDKRGMQLRKMGWNVVRVWEQELKFPKEVAAKLMKQF